MGLRSTFRWSLWLVPSHEPPHTLPCVHRPMRGLAPALPYRTALLSSPHSRALRAATHALAAPDTLCCTGACPSQRVPPGGPQGRPQHRPSAASPLIQVALPASPCWCSAFWRRCLCRHLPQRRRNNQAPLLTCTLLQRIEPGSSRTLCRGWDLTITGCMVVAWDGGILRTHPFAASLATAVVIQSSWAA